jgi:gliding motility-associated-like protein
MITPYRTFKLRVLMGLLFTTSLLPAQVTTATYDFQSLSVGLIAGQDNWQYMGNMNTSNNTAGSANCGIPSAAAPARVATTVSSGLYTGGLALFNPGTTGGTHCFVSRKNNAAWAYTIAPASDYLIMQFDYDNGNWWSESVNLGSDRNNDGNYSATCMTADANELGIGLSFVAGNILLHRADGTTITTTRPWAGWISYRITIDLRANGGQGAGYVCHRVLGTSGPWIPIGAFQNINMNINASSLNQNNLQRLDGMVVQQDAGGAGTVDNISISTYKNSNLIPVNTCIGSTLNLTSLTVPGTTVYSWKTPAGNTYTTSAASFSLANVTAAHGGTYNLSTDHCPPLTWTVGVKVNPVPVMTSVKSVTVCSGSDPNIIFTSNPGSTYSWIAASHPNVSGESLTTQTTGVLNNTLTSGSAVAETVIYSVTPTSTLGNCVGALQQVSVTVNPVLVPTVSIAASSGSICAGASVSFTATPGNGGTAPIYQWQVNGLNAGSGSTFSSATLNNNDVVEVILTSNEVCVSPATANSNTIIMTVNPVLVPTVSIAASSTTLCAGTSASFTATPGNGGTAPIYQWQVNGVNAGNGSTFSSATLNNNDVVHVILTSNEVCVSPATANSNTIIMTVNPVLVPTVSIAASSASICVGASVSFTATPTNGGSAPMYQWQVNGLNAGNGSTFSSATLNNNDVVEVILTSNEVCVSPATANSNTIIMTVNPVLVPTVSIAASSTTLCAGTSASFTATPGNGGTAPIYQWQVNGVNAGNGSTFSSATLNNNDVVHVILTSNEVCVSPATANSNTIIMTVNPVLVPTVSIAASSASICVGASVSFTATPTNGGSAPMYQWQVNGLNAGNGSTFSSATLNNNDVVEVILTSNEVCVSPATANSNTISVTVNPVLVPTVSIAASSASICAGASVSFTATPGNGGTAPMYQWQVNGVNAGNGSTFSSSTLNNNDVVEVILTSNAVCVSPATANSNTITMTVNPVLTPAVSIAASSASICAGTNVSFTATPTNGGTAPIYQWQVNGVNAGNGSTFSSATLNNNDVVEVILTSNEVCVSPATANSNTIAMTVNPVLVPTVSIAASSASICAGTSVSFTATPTNGGTAPVYQWLVNGVNAGNGSVFSSATLNNNDVVEVILTSNEVCVSPATANSNTISVTVNPVLVPTVSIAASSTSICAGASVSFTATPTNGGTAPIYQWQVNGVNAGNGSTFSSATLNNNDVVHVILTSNEVCVSPATANSNTIIITVNPVLVPTVSIAASSGSICAGTSASFTATPGNGGTAPIYQWQVNGVNAGNGSTFSSVTLNNNDVVHVILTSNEVCVSPLTANSNTIILTVLNTVEASVTSVASATSICAGTGISFTATPVHGGSAPGYQWQVNGINVGGNSPVFNSNTLLHGDRVTVIMTSSLPCVLPSSVSSAPIVLLVRPVPVASFVYAPLQVTDIAPDVSFQNTSLNSTSWTWYFGNGGTSGLEHPTYAFPGAGTYTVTLEAKNGNCISTTTRVIRVEEVSTYYMPNVFTPNGDGINDYFGPVGFGISDENYEMRIFNRWGELIYKASSASAAWDGRTPAGPVAEGVYVYVIEFNWMGTYKERIKKAGHVTLLR